MPNHTLQLACPSCQHPISISSQAVNQRFRCPNCATVFSVICPNPNNPTAVVARIVTPNATNDPLVPRNPAKPFSSTPKRPETRQEKYQRVKQLNKNRDREHRNASQDRDHQIQMSGVFLLAMPVLATVLPMFGLQIRRLSGAGTAAPIMGMFAGFIGAGMIAYARRNQGDSAALGGAAALFSLAMGIAGYSFLSFINGPEEDDDYTYRDPNRRPAAVAPASPPLSPEERKRKAEAAEQKRKETEAKLAESREKSRQAALEREAESERRREEREREAEALKERIAANRERVRQAQQDARDIINRTREEMGLSPLSSANGSKSSDSEPQAKFTRDNPDTEFLETLGFDRKHGKLRIAAHSLWNDGKRRFSAELKSDSFTNSFDVLPAVGEESTQGCLMIDADQSLDYIESLKFGGPEFVALYGKQEPSESAVICDQEPLAGFDVAFSGNQIIGLRARYRTEDAEVNNSHWIGQSSDDVRVAESDRVIRGFICFLEGTKRVGFSLVVEK